MSRWLRTVIVVGASLAALVLVVTVAWLVDDRLIHRSTVGRNVTLEGEAIGGLGSADLTAAVDERAAAVSSMELVVSTPDRTLVAANAETGIALDTATVVDAARSTGRDGGVLDDLRSWLRSFVEPRTVDPAYSLDGGELASWVEDHPDRVRRSPVEPSFTGRSGEIVINEGAAGSRLDPEAVVDAVATEIDLDRVPVAVDVAWTPVPPRVDGDTLRSAVSAARELTDRSLTVRVGDEVAVIGEPTIARWIDSERSGGDLVPVLAVDRIQRSLERILEDLETEGSPPEFRIVDGEVEVEYGRPPRECCGPGAGEVVAEAIETSYGGAVALPLVPVEDETEQVARLGIQELVGEFTTEHNCCEGRVDNIQRIADLVRGVVIEPGEEFSINDFVGVRTREKGFVAAGTIQQGRFVDGVGGGISQFATTMFNAAFFAGLDFEEYQSHSIYISRYPYGREATLSHPVPDLVVANNTPYGVLIWTEYTSTSITVQLWSTAHFEVEQTGQSTFGWGAACTRVETYRQRTDPDGEVIDDMVFAIYRPEEGLDCNGDPTPEVDN